MSSLAKVYLAERPDAAEVPDLGARLDAIVSELAQSAPDIHVDAEALAVALAGLPARVDALHEDAALEVALALACARNEAGALARFERDYGCVVEQTLRGMKLAQDVREEVAQEVRTKLLVADGGPPRLVGYAGRGSLRGLLKVTTTRAAITALRKLGREAPGDEAILDRSGERDPELAFLKERYRGVFREAFEDAVGALSPRDRNLLRLHFLQKVTLEALAEMYGMHRATVVRRLAKIRDALERATRKGLRERLGADGREVEEVMTLIQSRFDVSVERMLRTREE